MRVCNQHVKKSEESGGVSLKASYQVLVEIIYEREFDKKEKKKNTSREKINTCEGPEARPSCHLQSTD